MAIMLYRHPRTHRNQREHTGWVKYEGLEFDYIVLDESFKEEALKKGFHQTLLDAKKSIVANERPSRDELEEEANSLGVQFRSDIKDETLYKKILEARKG